jgi:hypothetical protein
MFRFDKQESTKHNLFFFYLCSLHIGLRQGALPKFQGDLESVALPWGSSQLGGKIWIFPLFRFLYRVSTGDYSEILGPGWHLPSPGQKRNTEDFTGANDGCYSGNGVPSRNRRPSNIDRWGCCCAQCYILSACSNRFALTATPASSQQSAQSASARYELTRLVCWGQMSHHAVWLNDLLSVVVGKS